MAAAAALPDTRPVALQVRPADPAGHAQILQAVIGHRCTDLPALVAEHTRALVRRLTPDLPSTAMRRKGFGCEPSVHHPPWTLAALVVRLSSCHVPRR